MVEGIGNKAIKGTFWAGCDRFGVMILQFIVNLVLARLLSPEAFGIIGMLYIFIAVSQTFIDGGFGSALIQKKEPTETDYSTILYWNITVGVITYLILYLSSPYIADFYKMPILSKILKVFGLSLIFNGIVNLQMNRLQKQLQFKTIAYTNIFSYIISATISIFAAISGIGVWSLVILAVAQPLLRCILLYLKTQWIPIGSFSKDSLKSLISFGGYLLLGNILESIFKNIQGLIIGRKFSADQMGYYSQADKLDQIVSFSIPQIIASVMYPVFSRFQEDKIKLQELVIINLRIISFVIYPILILLIIIAHPLISFLYGDKWIQSILYFQILCCGGFFYSLNNIPYYVVAAIGKSKTLFYWSFIKWLMFAAFLLVGMSFGMKGIMWAMVVNYANIFIINCLLAKRFINLKLSTVFSSLIPAFFTSGIIGLFSYVMIKYIMLNWTLIVLEFGLLYLMISMIFNKSTTSTVWATIKRLIS